MPKELSAKLLQTLSSQYGDSFYLLDSDVFEANYKDLLNSFAAFYPKCNIAYSYKTNYTPELVKIVDRLGGYAEVVSEMEMEIALRSGVNPSRIVWNGPVKNAEKVKELLLMGGTVNIDSEFEVATIMDVAEKHANVQINVGIRCNYDVGDGVVSRFGFDVKGESFGKVLNLIKMTPNVHLSNLQAHFAKRSPEYWTTRADGILEIYDRVVNLYGLKPERLDIGGGIYGKMPEELQTQIGAKNICFDDYAKRAAKQFAEHFLNDNDAPQLVIEPGTAIAGNCMRFVCKVETIKNIRGKYIATVNGSQKNISMGGINPPIQVVNCGNCHKDYECVDIVGYTCIEGDVIQRNYRGSLSVDDYVVVGNCGSYSIVMKPPFILPNVPVLDISSGKTVVIKRAETFDDLFATYCF